jgi:hypothetical protein
MIPRFVGCRLIINTIQVLFVVTPYLLNSCSVLDGFFYRQNEQLVTICVLSVCIGKCGLRCKMAEKIAGHCL